MTRHKSNVVRYAQCVRILRLIEWRLMTDDRWTPFDTETETRALLPFRLRARHAYVCKVEGNLCKIANNWSDPRLSRAVFG